MTMNLHEIIAEMRIISVEPLSESVVRWADELERLAGTPIAEVGHDGKLFWLVASLHSDWPDGTKLYAAPLTESQLYSTIDRQLEAIRDADAQIERLTADLASVRKAARDFLATIDDSPERTLLKAAIFE